MESYALVFVDNAFVVISYEDWMSQPFGYVLETSTDLLDLKHRAEWKNNEIYEHAYV
jgi:hypothetical protein